MRSERENRFGSRWLPSAHHTRKCLRTKRVPFRRRTHDQHPFHEGAGLARTLSTSSSRPCWPQPLGLTRASRQDASSLNQQTTDASRHPLDFLESSKALRTRPSPRLSTAMGANPRPFRVARRGGHRDVPASPSPPFTVGAKDTTREADLVRSPALRWLRREIGPKGTLPRVSEPGGSDSYLTPGRSSMIPVSRRRSPLPRAFSRRDPELVVATTRGSPSEDALGSWSSFAGRIQALFSMLLAFDDVHGHAARPHIPKGIVSHSFASQP